jgi:Pyruvate/2-oxoacid:ferredoxin oxidoreductase delta subunit
MGHLNSRNHARLAERLGQYVPGAHVSEVLVEILQHLVDEDEARLCSLMPLRKVSAEAMARTWDSSPDEASEILSRLSRKGVVVEYEDGDALLYVLAPPVLGFVEFSLMRTRDDLDAKELSRLYYQYCQIEGEFIEQQGSGHPALSRVFPGEDMLEDVTSEVLSYDRVSVGIDNATCITVGMCYCRHKMEHMGMACDATMDACLTFNNVAKHLSRNGIAREITKEEAHQIVRQCMDEGLVQIGDNTREGLAIICNCCACCCDLLLGYRRFGSSGLVAASAFAAEIAPETCCNCGECVERCPVDAIRADGPTPVVDPDVCLGCGVCPRFCSQGACTMVGRDQRVYTPRNFAEKTVLAAIDTAKLGNYLFSDQTSRVHARLRPMVNATLRVRAFKRLMQSRPVQSVIIRLMDRF